MFTTEFLTVMAWSEFYFKAERDKNWGNMRNAVLFGQKPWASSVGGARQADRPSQDQPVVQVMISIFQENWQNCARNRGTLPTGVDDRVTVQGKQRIEVFRPGLQESPSKVFVVSAWN